MVKYDITFHPSWWSARGFSFNRRFFYDCDYRLGIDTEMRRVLFDEFGEYSLGDKNPTARPLVDSDLLAGEFVQAMLMGCEIEFSETELPYIHPLNLDEDETTRFDNIQTLLLDGFAPFEEQYRSLMDRYGRVESYMDLTGVQNLALNLRGEELYYDYILNPTSADKFLSLSFETITFVANAIRRYTKDISGGVTSIVKKVCPDVFVTSNCSVDLVSEDTYEQFLLPYDLKLQKEFIDFGIHHCGKTMEHIAPQYGKIKPSFIEIGAGSDIKETLKHFDPTLTTVNLRYSPLSLLNNEPNEIKADIKRMYEDCNDFNKVSISCVGIDGSTTRPSICNFIESVCSLNS